MKKKTSSGKKQTQARKKKAPSQKKATHKKTAPRTAAKKKSAGKSSKKAPARLQRTGVFQHGQSAHQGREPGHTGEDQEPPYSGHGSDPGPAAKKGGGRRHITKTQPAEIDAFADDDIEDDEDLDPREKFMTLGDHLEELRVRILWILGVTIGGAVIAGVFSSQIHEAVVTPYREITDNRDLFLLNVYGPFESVVKLSLLTGFAGAFPIILLILWGFVTPALSRLGAFLGRVVIAASAVLFWGGMFFTWYYVLPASLQFLFVDMMHILPGTVPQMTLERYYSFVFLLEIGAGILFQVPIVLVILGGLGIITTEFHKQIWKHVIVGIFVLSALFTPPDPISQLLFAAPLLVLYLLAVLIVWVIEILARRRRRKEDREMAAG